MAKVKGSALLLEKIGSLLMAEGLSQVMGFLEGANKYKSPKYPQESISQFFPACRPSLVLSISCLMSGAES